MTEEKPEENAGEVETPEPAGSEEETPSTDQDSKSDSPDNEASTEEAAETAATDDTSSTGSEDSDADFPPNEDPVEIIIKATSNKEEGNGHFKNGDLDKAVRSYRKATNQLKPLNKNNTGDEQVKALLVTLQNNLSMVFFKQNKMKVSRDVATKSLKIDPTNVKALYRRSMAHRKMGDLENARDDLKEALKHEPNNAAVRKELLAVKKELVIFKEKQKKALVGAFSSGSSTLTLYQDKVEEKQKQLAEKNRKQQEEQKRKEQRKQMWEDECVSRMARNEPAISFDEWEKLQEEAEKKKKKDEEDRRKAERKARAAARKAAKAESESEDEELTPSELAMMRGYKKTADGRVTSYFTREQSAHEKNLLGDITPQRLEADSTPQPISSSTTSSTDATVQKGRPSVWNQAGTWEEKDTTGWCTERLREKLLETKYTLQAASLERYSASVSKVDSLTGDASVAITNGKKRYIFDYHVKLKFEVRDADVDEVIANGIISIPDICSTSHDELEVNFDGWKKKPASGHQESASECQVALISEIRASVQRWVEDFNNHY